METLALSNLATLGRNNYLAIQDYNDQTNNVCSLGHRVPMLQ